jgi:hypothetical protein
MMSNLSNKLLKINLLGLVLLFLFLISCSEKYESIHNCVLIPGESERFADTLIKDKAGGFLVSRLNCPNSTGLVCKYNFDSLKSQSEYKIVFMGKARTNYAHSNSAIYLSSIDVDDKIIDWKYIPLNYYYTDVNTWCYFKDSLYIKYENWNKPYKMFNIFTSLGNSSNEVFDCDTLYVQIMQKRN